MAGDREPVAACHEHNHANIELTEVLLKREVPVDGENVELTNRDGERIAVLFAGPAHLAVPDRAGGADTRQAVRARASNASFACSNARMASARVTVGK